MRFPDLVSLAEYVVVLSNQMRVVDEDYDRSTRAASSSRSSARGRTAAQASRSDRGRSPRTCFGCRREFPDLDAVFAHREQDDCHGSRRGAKSSGRDDVGKVRFRDKSKSSAGSRDGRPQGGRGRGRASGRGAHIVSKPASGSSAARYTFMAARPIRPSAEWKARLAGLASEVSVSPDKRSPGTSSLSWIRVAGTT